MPGTTVRHTDGVSIYATAVALDGEDHERDCPGRLPGRTTRRGKQINPTCRCGSGAPIAYQGSHVLPADDDTRLGSLLLCAIPGHISRDGRDLADPVATVWPWLRLSVHTDGDATAVLDYAQVQRVHAYLGEWLETADPKAV